MKAIIVLLSIMIAHANEFEPTPTLTIRIDNIKKESGFLKICLFNSKESFLKKAVRCEVISPIRKGEMKISLSGLPPGTYAVNVYHDENGNKKLDRGLFGLPSEPYGFSNNPTTTFGPPSFSEASFSVTGDKEISIKL